MTPTELAALARAHLARTTVLGQRPLLYLTLPAPRDPGRFVRLLGARGPLGELCTVTEDGRCVAVFKPEAVLRFLEREGLVP